MRSYWKIIGQAIREARHSIKETQRTTGLRLRMRPSEYAKAEDGEANPNSVLIKLLEGLREKDLARQDLDESLATAIRALVAANALADKAEELVNRWEQPSWKDTKPTAGFIYALREAVAAYEEAIK